MVTGVDNTPAASLEGVTPTLTYYAGFNAGGTVFSGAPTGAGTYTVVASFAGSADYGAASGPASFTINPATPTVAVTDAGGAYDGSAFAASATATSATVGATVASLPVPAYFYPTRGRLSLGSVDRCRCHHANHGHHEPGQRPRRGGRPKLRRGRGQVAGREWQGDRLCCRTDYGAVAAGNGGGQIDDYRNWYHLDGIFVDQMTNDGSDLAYYQAIYQYVHSQQPRWIVVGNPGSNTLEAYAQLPVAERPGPLFLKTAPATTRTRPRAGSRITLPTSLRT